MDQRRDEIMEFFEYTHLPPFLQEVSRSFCHLAESMVKDLPRCAERTAGLRKLLEAKDCAVRCAILKKKQEEAARG